MTLEEYEETFWPTPTQLLLEDLIIGQKFYFDHPDYAQDRPFQVYDINANGIYVGEVNEYRSHGLHYADIPVRKV